MVEQSREMAKMGFGYSRRDVIKLANDIIQETNRACGKSVFHKWYRGFMRGWPELSVLQLQSLAMPRAKGANGVIVAQYYDALKYQD